MSGLDAVLVDVEPLQRETEDMRAADDAMVGELLAQDDVAGRHERRECEEDAVRRAVRDQQRIDRGLEAERSQPLDAGGAVIFEARDRPALAHPRLVLLGW